MNLQVKVNDIENNEFPLLRDIYRMMDHERDLVSSGLFPNDVGILILQYCHSKELHSLVIQKNRILSRASVYPPQHLPFMRKFVVWVTEKNDEDVTLEDFITITTRHLANQRGELCNVWRTIQFNVNIYLANGALWIRFDGSLFIIWWRLNATDKLSISERTLSPEGYNRDNPDMYSDSLVHSG